MRTEHTMESGIPQLPITEDVVLYFLSRLAARRGSRLFFKVTHNMSEDRPWHFWCAPDLDLLEVLPDNAVISYEMGDVGSEALCARPREIEPDSCPLCHPPG